MHSYAEMLAINGYITVQTINVNGGWYMSWLASWF
jgi:hypothetical protein